MFSRLSSQYYVGEMYVEPTTDERAVMHTDLHDKITSELYSITKDNPINLETPVIIKIEDKYIEVFGSDDIPSPVLSIPNRIIDRLRIRNPPTSKEVFLPTKNANIGFLWRQKR